MEILLGRRQAAEFLDLAPAHTILDVATGTGTLANELAKLGHSVVGVDSSAELLTQARQKYSHRLNLRFEHADATALPYHDGGFDASSISFALHDMSYETRIKVLEEMKRVTRPHGSILVVDYNEPRKHWVARWMYPLFRASESANFPNFIRCGLDSLLNETDLKVSRQTTYLGMVQIVLINQT